MISQTRLTPGRKYLTGTNARALENSIIDSSNKKVLQQSIVWGTLNFCLLSIVLYDIINTCPIYVTYLQYIEYFGAVVLFLNIIYHAITYIRIQISLNKAIYESIQASPTSTPIKCGYTPQIMDVTPLNVPRTPMNLSSTSWMSNASPNDSQNISMKSNSWVFSYGSAKSNGISPSRVSRLNTSEVDFINDETTLSSYLKDFEAQEKVNSLSKVEEPTANVLNSFWTHPTAKTSKDVSSYLKRCHYQLSTPAANGTPSSPNIPNYYYGPTSTYPLIGKCICLAKPLSAASILIASTSNSPKSDDKGSPHGSPVQGMDTWRRLHVDPLVLTQWNANLRVWLSQTILNRLVKEFIVIDEGLQKHGFGDVQIGKVGLERLRKTAQTIPVLHFVQTLPSIIPFLELTPNQEYLVKRIRELAQGGCMSDFKWNSGSSFNGKQWDRSLPTDSAIVMHLFASYLDTQLQPLPNKPDVKAFSGYHLIKLNEKPNINASTLAIQQCSEYPPHFKVIVGEEIFELVKGYNNLFHTILLFLYYVNKREHGMLGQVNLGRSGVNLLWVIQS